MLGTAFALTVFGWYEGIFGRSDPQTAEKHLNDALSEAIDLMRSRGDVEDADKMAAAAGRPGFKIPWTVIVYRKLPEAETEAEYWATRDLLVKLIKADLLDWNETNSHDQSLYTVALSHHDHQMTAILIERNCDTQDRLAFRYCNIEKHQ
jgi:hypothetical protein